jgi:hypothetical protein
LTRNVSPSNHLHYTRSDPNDDKSHQPDENSDKKEETIPTPKRGRPPKDATGGNTLLDIPPPLMEAEMTPHFKNIAEAIIDDLPDREEYLTLIELALDNISSWIKNCGTKFSHKTQILPVSDEATIKEIPMSSFVQELRKPSPAIQTITPTITQDNTPPVSNLPTC